MLSRHSSVEPTGLEFELFRIIDKRLQALGIELPNLTGPSANYMPVRFHGGVVLVSGQVPRLNGSAMYVGKVGKTISREEAYQAARLCAINMIAQLRVALDGDLDRVVACLRIRGFVNATEDFTDHPTVIDGASDLVVEVFGDAGRHSRTALGVSSLPRGFSVEVDGDFAVA